LKPAWINDIKACIQVTSVAAGSRLKLLKKLDENHGNISRTAEVLGLERSHLYRKMKALGIAVKE